MKLSTGALGAATFAALTFAAMAGAAAQDAAKGEKVFNQCKACHSLENALVGPPLAGVVGRKAGTVQGYSYSPLMKAAGEAGLTWTADNLVAYLQGPTDYLRKYVKDKGKEAGGSSKMIFMLSNETKRKDVVAYLATTK